MCATFLMFTIIPSHCTFFYLYRSYIYERFFVIYITTSQNLYFRVIKSWRVRSAKGNVKSHFTLVIFQKLKNFPQAMALSVSIMDGHRHKSENFKLNFKNSAEINKTFDEISHTCTKFSLLIAFVIQICVNIQFSSIESNTFDANYM